MKVIFAVFTKFSRPESVTPDERLNLQTGKFPVCGVPIISFFFFTLLIVSGPLEIDF